MTGTATAGRQRLLTIVRTAPRAEVASVCEVTVPTIAAWLTGKARPDAQRRAILQARYGIDPGDWVTDEERGQLERIRAAQ
mgnify:CR=1 FL=1